MIKLVVVPPEAVIAVWPRLDDLYEEACRYSKGTLTKDIVKARAIGGMGQLWIAADDTAAVTATCMTSTIAFPGGLRAMFVELVGGTIKSDIFDFRTTLEKQAIASGCSAVFFMLPRRWANKLPDYKISHILMCKELA